MANESTNRSEERFRSCGEKRWLTDGHESESESSKKARGSGEGEVRLAANVKKVAEILLVLATMVEMRGGRKATSVEVEMMIEARRKVVEICEEFGPKDVFDNDVFGIIVDDLGLGRMKETKLAACCPKVSIGEKLEVRKVKMEEDEFYSPRVTEPHAASHGVRKFSSGKADFQHHSTMVHASGVSDSITSPFELPISEVRPGGSNALTSSHLGKHSIVRHTREEIATIVQNMVHARMPDHKAWTVPSTSDYMNKVLTCQTCECVISEMYGAVICDACESACHLRCVQFNSKPIPEEDWHCLKCLENRNGKPFPSKYGRVVKKASKPEMSSSSTAGAQPSTEKEVQSSDESTNQKTILSVTEDLLNSLTQNQIKLECDQKGEIREDEEGVERGNFVKTSETCTAVEENEGSVSSGMHDVEWVGDKLNEVDAKTYYRSCCINGTTYQLQQYALFSSTGKNLVPGKLQAMWEDINTNKKWVTVTRCFFPDDLPESVGRPGAPESYEVYESNYQLTLSAGLIHGPCEVLPPKKFSKIRAMQSRAQTTASDKPKPLFLCKWFYT